MDLAADLQAFAHEELPGWIDLREELDPPGNLRGDAPASLDDECVFMHRGNALGRDDARQIQWIGGGDERPVWTLAAGPWLPAPGAWCLAPGLPQVPQFRHGRFQGKLLATDAGDEPAAAHLAAQFHPPQHA